MLICDAVLCVLSVVYAIHVARRRGFGFCRLLTLAIAIVIGVFIMALLVYAIQLVVGVLFYVLL